MNIRFRVPYAPGDIWAATPFLRDFAEQRPGDVLFLDTPYPEILRNNPFQPERPRTFNVEVVFRFTPDYVTDGRRYYGVNDPASSMRTAFHRALRAATNIRIEPRTTAPEFYPDDFERRYSPAPTDKPVCVLNAGHKLDIPVKHWGVERFAAVVDALKDRVLFVQVGAARNDVDRHARIPGALDLVGKTTLRDLAALVYHADFVLTGVSQLHHLAGIACYKPRHCVTIAGAREPRNWANGYRREGVTWHWLDANTCEGAAPGCWHDDCRNCPAMASITPERVIEIIEGALK